jgi:hypothetical protein
MSWYAHLVPERTRTRGRRARGPGRARLGPPPAAAAARGPGRPHPLACRGLSHTHARTEQRSAASTRPSPPPHSPLQHHQRLPQTHRAGDAARGDLCECVCFLLVREKKTRAAVERRSPDPRTRREGLTNKGGRVTPARRRASQSHHHKRVVHHPAAALAVVGHASGPVDRTGVARRLPPRPAAHAGCHRGPCAAEQKKKAQSAEHSAPARPVSAAIGPSLPASATGLTPHLRADAGRGRQGGHGGCFVLFGKKKVERRAGSTGEEARVRKERERKREGIALFCVAVGAPPQKRT